MFSRPCAITELWPLSSVERVSSAVSAWSMSPVRALSAPTSRPSWSIRSRACGSWPPIALLSSTMMVRSWSSPPPLRTAESRAKVSSRVGALLVRASPRVEPSLRSGPEAWAGRLSEM